MPRFSVIRDRIGTEPTVVLRDAGSGREAGIACRGAALLRLVTRDAAGVLHDVASGYRSAEEVVRRPGSRFAVMAPFAGRIADARYAFDGVAQDLAPGVEGAQRGVRHGFVRDAEFSVAELDADAHAARVTLVTAAIRPRPGYPFAIDLGVTFTLDAAGLTLEAAMRNVGDRAAPCFFGWHPYFKVGDGAVDGWELTVPAQSLVRTGADLIALAGQQAYVALDDAPALDFRQGRRIGASILDQGYLHLDSDGDGRIRTRLRDPSTGRGVALWQERGLVHVFTADTVARDVRRAVAIEPMECMADAFNRPEWAAAVRLEAGAERRFRCGVEIIEP